MMQARALTLFLALIGFSLIAAPAFGEGSDVEISLLTPFGTPMAGAVVEVTRLDGITTKQVADALGRVVVHNAPLGAVDVTILSWKGIPVNYTVIRVTSGAIIVKRVGKLTVKVLGALGQSLEGVKVQIESAEVRTISDFSDYEKVVWIDSPDLKVITEYTGPSGMLTLELPEGRYFVKAEKTYYQVFGKALVKGGENTLLTLRLDIVTVGSWDMSLADFIGLILFISVLALITLTIVRELARYFSARSSSSASPLHGLSELKRAGGGGA
jgi:hypothetical protein